MINIRQKDKQDWSRWHNTPTNGTRVVSIVRFRIVIFSKVEQAILLKKARQLTLLSALLSVYRWVVLLVNLTGSQVIKKQESWI